MTNREMLEAAVLANIDDDVPRLLYADCCEEEGDLERATFIRASIQAWRSKGKVLKPPRGKGREWAGDLIKELPGKTKFEWRRGFLASISINSYEVRDHIDDMVRVWPLEYLHILDCMPGWSPNRFEIIDAIYCWHLRHDETGYHTSSELPKVWFDKLEGHRVKTTCWYSTPEEARLDLSNAILAVARQCSVKKV